MVCAKPSNELTRATPELPGRRDRHTYVRNRQTRAEGRGQNPPVRMSTRGGGPPLVGIEDGGGASGWAPAPVRRPSWWSTVTPATTTVAEVVVDHHSHSARSRR